MIVGSGPFTFASKSVHATPITVEGQLCQPTQLKRDIVFVIDVSGSMANPQNHDPRVSNSCGRLNALQTVIASVAKAGLTRFGLVTFSSTVQMTTGGFSSSGASLYSNMLSISKTSQLADIVCAGNGGTNYDDALTGAANILKGSTDPNTSREIYFISDGEPDPSQYDGVAIANNLKSSGVTIATLMLIGDDQGLQAISSIDQTDPNKTRLLNLEVADAAQLAATLTQLAQNYLVSGTIKYHAIGSNQWVSFDLMAIQKNFQFKLAAFPTDAQLAPYGLEVSLDYWDKRGMHYGNVGQVLWSSN